MQMKLDEVLNLVPVEKWRDFCTPSPFRDLLKSDLGNSQAKCFVPILGNGMLVSVLWNHNFIFDGNRRGNPSLGQSARPKTTPDSVGSAPESALQRDPQVMLYRNGVADTSLNN